VGHGQLRTASAGPHACVAAVSFSQGAVVGVLAAVACCAGGGVSKCSKHSTTTMASNILVWLCLTGCISYALSQCFWIAVVECSKHLTPTMTSGVVGCDRVGASYMHGQMLADGLGLVLARGARGVY
jgi:hypothetical protein